MFKFAQYMNLFHEFFSAFVTATCFHVVLHSDWILHVPAPGNFSIAPFTNLFDDFNIFLFDDEVETLIFFQKLVQLSDLLRWPTGTRLLLLKFY